MYLALIWASIVFTILAPVHRAILSSTLSLTFKTSVTPHSLSLSCANLDTERCTSTTSGPRAVILATVCPKYSFSYK